jgi:hypothetical protein
LLNLPDGVGCGYTGQLGFELGQAFTSLMQTVQQGGNARPEHGKGGFAQTT